MEYLWTTFILFATSSPYGPVFLAALTSSLLMEAEISFYAKLVVTCEDDREEAVQEALWETSWEVQRWRLRLCSCQMSPNCSGWKSFKMGQASISLGWYRPESSESWFYPRELCTVRLFQDSLVAIQASELTSTLLEGSLWSSLWSFETGEEKIFDLKTKEWKYTSSSLCSRRGEPNTATSVRES